MEKLDAGARKLGYRLSRKQLEQFHEYYRELCDWNRRFNLTTITGYEEVQIKHFLDSLTVVAGLRPRDKTGQPNVLDIGTGAGFPGIPLKIILPGISLTLLESVAKKAAFLRHLKEKLVLEDVEVLTGRAEDIAHRESYRESFDIVVSRGVAPLATLVELALPFCATGGRFITQKKGNIGDEVEQAATATALTGGSLNEVKNLEMEEFDDERCLVIIDKTEPTPDRYPRRPGLPAKRPLS